MAAGKSRTQRQQVPSLLPDDFGYENLLGVCGMCGARLIVNRATDLGNSSWAIGMFVTCTECKSKLRINGDTGSHPIDHFLIWNYLALKAQRQYMNCVLSLAQALEIALVVTVRFVLVSHPIARDQNAPEIDAKELTELFLKKTRNMTLEPLRNLLMKLAVHAVRPETISEAHRWTAEINKLAKDSPSARLVQAIPDDQSRRAVETLSRVTIGALRNDVAHQQGRRPSEQEVENQHQQVRAAVREVMTAFGVTPGGGQLIVGPLPESA